MPSKKKKSAHLTNWQYADQSTPFTQLADDLLKHDKYKALSYSARQVYVCMLSYKTTTEHNRALYKALKEHAAYGHFDNHDRKLFKESGELSEFDFERISDDRNAPLFVFSKKAAEEYGIEPRTLYRAIEELIEAGFISVFGNCYGARRLATVYVFSVTWKKSGKIKNLEDKKSPKEPILEDKKSPKKPKTGGENTPSLEDNLSHPLISTPESDPHTTTHPPSELLDGAEQGELSTGEMIQSDSRDVSPAPPKATEPTPARALQSQATEPEQAPSTIGTPTATGPRPKSSEPSDAFADYVREIYKAIPPELHDSARQLINAAALDLATRPEKAILDELGDRIARLTASATSAKETNE